MNFSIKWDRILRNNFEGDLRLFTDFDKRVHIINISPLINYKTLEKIPEHSKAIILVAYGMGGMPTDRDMLMAFIGEQIKNEILVCVMTQCLKGGVSPIYETGSYLVDKGAVLANDMTLECL